MTTSKRGPEPVPRRCPVCDYRADVETVGGGGASTIDCERCGKFRIGWIAGHELSGWSTMQKARLSAWIRENQGCTIVEPDLKRLAELRNPSVGEKADKLLLWMTRGHPKAGTPIQLFLGGVERGVNAATRVTTFLSAKIRPEVFARAWAQDDEEVLFLVLEYLIDEKRYLADADNGLYRVTPAGWSYVHSLTQGAAQSSIGFVAMWFDACVAPAYTAIDIAIRDSGYEALRVDRKEHNNKIDDEIIAGIRRAKFLVADFTGQRGGVYFEAGFAAGLGLPVIWLCRRDELEKVHFDTRQYNHIPWEENKLADLTAALRLRIEATIGRGPLINSSTA